MHGTGSVKVPNGKLVRVEATYDESIESVQITGDFFLEPPEALSDLEEAVEGLPADASTDDLATAYGTVEADLIGFDAEALAEATREAMQ